MKTKVYLSGSVANAPEGFDNWRLEADSLSNIVSDNLLLYNPMDHFNYTDCYEIKAMQSLKYFTWLIKKSDVVLVNLDNSDKSVGTGVELNIALNLGKPIIGFGSNPNSWYSWCEDMCDVTLNDLTDALLYIDEHY